MELLIWLLLSTFLTNSRAELPPLSSDTLLSTNTWHVMENEALVKECPCSAEAVNITWYYEPTKEGIPTEERERVHSAGQNLWFLPTSKNDTGVYICVITQRTHVKWCQLILEVHEFFIGICFTHEMRIWTPSERRASARIPCSTAKDYNVTENFKWYKECNPIQGRKYIMIGNELNVIGLNQQDAGNYTCKFTYERNGTEYNVTQTKILRVQAPSATIFPIIESPKNGTLEVKLGSAVNITCSAFLGYGKPMVDFVYWLVNGKEVVKLECSRFRVHSERTTINESYTSTILKITEVWKEDLFSNFTCIALNNIGWTNSTVTLKLKAKDIQKYVLISFCTFVTIIVLVIFLYKFYRVDAVLLYRDMFQPLRSTDDGKIYDAYVIYATQCQDGSNESDPVDNFVYNILLDVLENNCGYTLYIHGRNRQPGEDVSTAADWNIGKSRRLIIILNSELVCSKEFTVEQQMGLYSALVSNDLRVIVIEMEEVGDDSKLQESLRHIIKKRGTIKWQSGNSTNMKSPKSTFWKQVRYQMPGRKSPPSDTAALKEIL